MSQLTHKQAQEIAERIRLDIHQIRTQDSRYGKLSKRPVRWEGPELNPNGYRTIGDMADDMERLLNEL